MSLAVPRGPTPAAPRLIRGENLAVPLCRLRVCSPLTCRVRGGGAGTSARWRDEAAGRSRCTADHHMAPSPTCSRLDTRLPFSRQRRDHRAEGAPPSSRGGLSSRPRPAQGRSGAGGCRGAPAAAWLLPQPHRGCWAHGAINGPCSKELADSLGLPVSQGHSGPDGRNSLLLATLSTSGTKPGDSSAGDTLRLRSSTAAGPGCLCPGQSEPRPVPDETGVPRARTDGPPRCGWAGLGGTCVPGYDGLAPPGRGAPAGPRRQPVRVHRAGRLTPGPARPPPRGALRGRGGSWSAPGT